MRPIRKKSGVSGGTVEECLLAQTSDFRLVRVIIECTWYINSMLDDTENRCFEDKFAAAVSDPFRQEVHAEAATIVKFVEESCQRSLSNASYTVSMPLG
ncbi:MAG: hypothetical protein AB1351_07245 [Thermoproteota archaeon]